MVFSNERLTVHYDLPDGVATSYPVNFQTPLQQLTDVVPTGLPYPVLVDLTDAVWQENPATVELYDRTLLVGGAEITENGQKPFVLPAWKGDPAYKVVGFEENNPISIVLRDEAGEKIPVRFSGDLEPRFGEGPYTLLALDAVPLPTRFEVESAYPNPFNSTTVLPFSIPADGELEVKVFNILGQAIYQQVQTYNAGTHRYVLDLSATHLQTGTGIYFVQVAFGGESRLQKIVMVK